MPDDPDDLLAWSSGVLRRFAAATNLLIPGRRFAVHGAGPRTDALAAVLSALGARRVEFGAEPADYLFATGEGVAPLTLPAMLDLASGTAAFVVVDAGIDGAALDRASLGPLDRARPGVEAVAAQAGAGRLFVVSVAGPVAATVAGPAAPPSVTIRHSATDATDRIRWARRFMPIAARAAAELAAVNVLRADDHAGDRAGDHTDDGIRIGISMVLEPKTAVLALLLRNAGAVVSVFAHPDETDDAVADALRDEGVPVFAASTASPPEHRALALAFLDARPQLLLDDGAHLIRLAHTDRPSVLPTLLAAAEETTSGVRPLRLMAAAGELAIPVVSVNDARSKTLFDNLYGTGQACVFAVLDLLDAVGGADLRGRTVAVAGFGHVGQGVARTVAALGGTVVVADPDPVRALQATFAGFRVAALGDAVRHADLVLSATGVADTLSLEILRSCAPNAVVAVAGGVPHEVALEEAVAAGATLEPVAPKVDRLLLDGAPGVLLLDRGGCINITAGEGNPIDIMDLSFAVQLGAVRYLLEDARPGGVMRLAPGVHPLPAAADDRVAALALAERGLGGDGRVDGYRGDPGAENPDWASRRFTDGTEPA